MTESPLVVDFQFSIIYVTLQEQNFTNDVSKQLIFLFYNDEAQKQAKCKAHAIRQSVNMSISHYSIVLLY